MGGLRQEFGRKLGFVGAEAEKQEVQTDSRQESIHTQERNGKATAGNIRFGKQGGGKRCDADTWEHIRAGFSGLLIRISSKEELSSGIEDPERSDHVSSSEPCRGSGHQGIFRQCVARGTNGIFTDKNSGHVIVISYQQIPESRIHR